MIHKTLYYFRHAKDDIPADIVVFLVALPLYLSIALASGAPLFSGLIAGLVGGLVVSWVSGLQLSDSHHQKRTNQEARDCLKLASNSIGLWKLLEECNLTGL